ncbi:MAG: acyl-CoA thioesterase [Bacteroidetes bacterium]|nr:acyl-CoA thioesterase [Bacteroidota bacterium]MBU1680702.1 acyl-CoA thioesterase [Bacteroidota bacterium]MBU2505211.1 acyl-CoA thioesterase [Bacteroidota bacterium]
MHKFEHKISFLYSDPGGILFYSKLFEITHLAFEDFIHSLDLDLDFFYDPVYAFPIIHTEADYISQIKIHETILVELIVSELRDSSFEINYLLKNENVLKAKSKTVHVAVNKQKFSKVTLPGKLRDKLKLHLS